MQEIKVINKEKILMMRAQLLAASDWTQLPDVDKPEWREYRQQLRDLTKQDGFPDRVVWPKPPEV